MADSLTRAGSVRSSPSTSLRRKLHRSRYLYALFAAPFLFYVVFEYAPMFGPPHRPRRDFQPRIRLRSVPSLPPALPRRQRQPPRLGRRPHPSRARHYGATLLPWAIERSLPLSRASAGANHVFGGFGSPSTTFSNISHQACPRRRYCPIFQISDRRISGPVFRSRLIASANSSR